jgi:hypothetical protein
MADEPPPHNPALFGVADILVKNGSEATNE